jgi:predicted metal-dependent hydrolase
MTKKPVPARTELLLDGKAVSVAVRVSARARSYRLTVPHHGDPVLTFPVHGQWADAERFLERHRPWLATRLKRSAPATRFAHGEQVPLRGVPHRIAATGRLRGRVELAMADGEPQLLVPGEPDRLSRRLSDWLKAEAHKDLTERSLIHAQTLGVTVKAVTMRAQSTRWGSCSSTGRLSYNWRLVLAPPFVLDYVAAHEVAHLVHMNHSPTFWKTVGVAMPDMERGRAWLKAHGKVLMGYGLGEDAGEA